MTTRPTPFDPSTVLSAMTPEEKVALLSGRDFWSLNGVERLGVPSIVVTDGPYGLRKAKATGSTNIADSVPATCFPTSSALAATWSPELVEEVASAIGREAAAEARTLPALRVRRRGARAALLGPRDPQDRDDPVHGRQRLDGSR